MGMNFRTRVTAVPGFPLDHKGDLLDMWTELRPEKAEKNFEQFAEWLVKTSKSVSSQEQTLVFCAQVWFRMFRGQFFRINSIHKVLVNLVLTRAGLPPFL